MTTDDARPLRTLLGDHAASAALKDGRAASGRLRLEFADVKVPNTAFKRVVRDREFDVAELALYTYLIAKAHGAPLVLLPIVVMARAAHPYLVHDAQRGPLAPASLAGKRIGLRSYSVTTAAWVRQILRDEHGVAPQSVRWVSFEEPHVAEFRDPPNVERAPPGSDMMRMLEAGELDAAIVGALPAPGARLQPVIADHEAAAERWRRTHGTVQINHMMVVRAELLRDDPWIADELCELFSRGRALAARPDAATGLDPQAIARGVCLAADEAVRQGLIERVPPLLDV